MAPQLQINQGPQDALLYDNSRSYFTNVGYSRTSNFQMELVDVDSQNNPSLDTTVQFIIPKAADLLGPVDLMVTMGTATNVLAGSNKTAAFWVESLGFAMIERVTLSVGSQDIETISGEQLNIMNELMKSGDARLGRKTVLKTGAPPYYIEAPAAHSTDSTAEYLVASYRLQDNNHRVIYFDQTIATGPSLIVPLGLFFTKHPGSYLPLGAIAGCNEVRVSIKFRPLKELYQLDVPASYRTTLSDKKIDLIDPTAQTPAAPTFASGNAIASCKLRCQMIHVTGPEATTLMNKEHVRLLKLWQNNNATFTASNNTSEHKLVSMDLSFLHPVSELIITIRKKSEMSGSSETNAAYGDEDQKAKEKNWFAYHGESYMSPNVDAFFNKVSTPGLSIQDAVDPALLTTSIKTTNFKLKLNGQERHSSIDGMTREYLMDRLMPMLHSGTVQGFELPDLQVGTIRDHGHGKEFNQLDQLFGRKEIYVIPFSLNPEGANPSGAVNFSKVSHAKLEIYGKSMSSAEYQVDVYGVYYNWLQIKDGRALVSFA